MEWKLVNTKGALVTGTFGHSATYDRAKDLVFVYGGYALLVDSTSERKEVSSMLFSFNPNTKIWYVLYVVRMFTICTVFIRNLPLGK